MPVLKLLRHIGAAFFEYDTPKIVHINSMKVGIVNRLLQLFIIVYIIGFAIIWEKGYQDFDEGISSVTTKVKGVAFTNLSEFPELKDRLWDVADYVIPPQENNAFFITTNMIITEGQEQGRCDEAPGIRDAACETDADCPAMMPVKNGHGIRTGKCVTSTQKAEKKVCEVYAWCPVERNELLWEDKPLIDPTNFTVFIKNNVEFPKFGVKRRNIVTSNLTYVTSCQYDPEDDPYCPVFRVGRIVQLAGSDATSLGVKGGAIGVTITWDCDFDHDVDECLPSYRFESIDVKRASVAPGWNFRYAHYYGLSGIDKRTLIKAYGIRFVILVKAMAGKFNGVPLLLNLGSGLGLLAVASIMCDMFVLNCLKKAKYYRDKKFLYVKGDDAYQIHMVNELPPGTQEICIGDLKDEGPDIRGKPRTREVAEHGIPNASNKK